MVSVSAIWVAVVTSTVSVTGISVSVSSVSISSISISAIVSFWFSISFGFTLVQLVDSIGGSWGADVLVADGTGYSVWGISVWGISVTVWSIGTIEKGWGSFSIGGSLATVVSVSVSVSVVWVSVTVSMTIVSAISIASISKTISIRAIVSFWRCFGFWFSNNGCDEAQGKNGKFHHFEYELFEQNPHKYLSQAIEFV